MSRRAPWIVLALALAGALPAQAAEPQPMPGVKLVDAFPGVKFNSALHLTAPKDGTDDIYVCEQSGRALKLTKWRGVDPVPAPTVFLDLTSRVAAKGQGGLSSIAFHPGYKDNGRVFAFYTAADGAAFKVVVSEFKAGGGRVDLGTEKVLLHQTKKTPHHNGGALAFGPDGKLWIGTGDDRIPENAVNTSQNMKSLLGKILRIDVDAPSGALAYGIPSDNPWPKSPDSVRPEIWAYGFRNAWRIGWDSTGAPYVASPGAEKKEWVHKAVRGGNHGWPFFEGSLPNMAVPPSRASEKFVQPTWEYDRPTPDSATAIIGGVFYKGTRVPALGGKYVFADYSRGAAYALTLDAGGGKDWKKLGDCPECASVGEDAQGEVYFVSNQGGGSVYTLAPQ